MEYKLYLYKNGYGPIGFDLESDLFRFTKNISINNIFDVGGNIGQTVNFFSSVFPEANIYSFEPIESTFKQLQKNSENFEKVKCFNHAFGEQSGEVKCYIQGNSQFNSLSSEINTNDQNNYEIVTVKTIDDFCQENNIETIDILKTDTEGYDLEVIKGAEKMLSQNKIKFILSEVGFSKEDNRHTSFGQLNQYLDNYNFHFAGLYDNLYIKGNKGDEKYQIVLCNALFANYEESI